MDPKRKRGQNKEPIPVPIEIANNIAEVADEPETDDSSDESSSEGSGGEDDEANGKLSAEEVLELDVTTDTSPGPLVVRQVDIIIEQSVRVTQIPAPPPAEPTAWEPFNFPTESSGTSSASSFVPDEGPNFSNAHGVPKNIPPDCTQPIHFFSLLFTDAILERFVAATNRYGAGKRIDFHPTSVAELKKLFAIVLIMGLVKQPQTRSYWFKKAGLGTKLYRHDLVASAMSRNRFEELFSYLHFRDVVTLTAEERERLRSEDALYLVSEFTDMLCENYSRYFECGDYIDIDEMCIRFKGRHSFRFFIPSKPARYHFRAYCLSDQSGYLYCFYLYRGTRDHEQTIYSASAFSVAKLTDSDVFRNKNHLLFVDNYFMSLEVVQICQSRGIHCIGTCKLKRK